MAYHSEDMLATAIQMAEDMSDSEFTKLSGSTERNLNFPPTEMLFNEASSPFSDTKSGTNVNIFRHLILVKSMSDEILNFYYFR